MTCADGYYLSSGSEGGQSCTGVSASDDAEFPNLPSCAGILASVAHASMLGLIVCMFGTRNLRASIVCLFYMI